MNDKELFEKLEQLVGPFENLDKKRRLKVLALFDKFAWDQWRDGYHQGLRDVKSVEEVTSNQSDN
jgi:hypothetical protein